MSAVTAVPLDKAVRLGRPALISDAPLPPAVRERWSSLEYLRRAHSDTPVQVSLTVDGELRGTVDTHETATMRFGTFLDRVHETADGHWEPRASSLRFHLAQCPLSYLPVLERDALPPQCLPAPPQRSNLWFAVGATVSNMHYDCWHNLLQVVRGQKRVLLLPPWCTSRLEPRPAHGASANHSALDDAQAVAACPGESTVHEIGPGDTLFIPEGWWHRVESPDEVTVGLNFWWCAHDSPFRDAGMAAYVLRRAFDSLVRDEQRRLRSLAEGLGPAAPAVSAPASDCGGQSLGGEGGAVLPPCAECGREFSAAPGGEASLFLAAEAGERKLLAWLPRHQPQQVAWCLGEGASSMPLRVRSMLREDLSPASAFALGECLDQALHLPCAGCAERAQRWVDAAFDSSGEGTRSHLVALTDSLLATAAQNVLAHTLGLRGLGLGHAERPGCVDEGVGKGREPTQKMARR